MDAPTYPPAAAFEQPVGEPFVLQLDNVSIAELMNVAAAREIVLRHLPWLKAPLEAPWLKPHLGNFTVAGLAGASQRLTPETAAAVNEELRRLPPIQEIKP